jgi:hypothetical protein
LAGHDCPKARVQTQANEKAVSQDFNARMGSPMFFWGLS